jgi:glycosyltransferase involved in cell wall biosynthesis
MWNHGSLAGKVLAGRDFFETRRWLRQAPFAVYVSQRFLQGRYPCSGVSIGCSDVIIERPAREVLERRLKRLDEGLGDAPAVLGLVGSLNVGYKGHETALRALALLVYANPNLRLRLLGEGKPSRWHKLAVDLGVEEHVEFCGSLPDGHAVLQWMDELTLLIAPSRQEGIGRAIVEAMSRALPIIGSNVGGIPELIDHRCTHPPRDHKRLAQLIKGLLDNPERLKELVRANWSTAHEYASDVLQERRSRFWRKFKTYVSGSGPGCGTRALVRSPQGGDTVSPGP